MCGGFVDGVGDHAPNTNGISCVIFVGGESGFSGTKQSRSRGFWGAWRSVRRWPLQWRCPVPGLRRPGSNEEVAVGHAGIAHGVSGHPHENVTATDAAWKDENFDIKPVILGSC